MAYHRRDASGPEGSRWRLAHRALLAECGIPDKVADSDRRWAYLLLHGSDHPGSGWRTSWVSPEQASRLLDLDRERHGSGTEHLAGQSGSVLLEVYPSADTVGTIDVRLGFRVRSVADAVTAAREGGGSVLSLPRQSPWDLRAVVCDPDGHRVELSEGTGA